MKEREPFRQLHPIVGAWLCFFVPTYPLSLSSSLLSRLRRAYFCWVLPWVFELAGADGAAGERLPAACFTVTGLTRAPSNVVSFGFTTTASPTCSPETISIEAP